MLEPEPENKLKCDPPILNLNLLSFVNLKHICLPQISSGNYKIIFFNNAENLISIYVLYFH